jgi:hypothetical protein
MAINCELRQFEEKYLFLSYWVIESWAIDEVTENFFAIQVGGQSTVLDER